jgi:hypothetical protein
VVPTVDGYRSDLARDPIAPRHAPARASTLETCIGSTFRRVRSGCPCPQVSPRWCSLRLALSCSFMCEPPGWSARLPTGRAHGYGEGHGMLRRYRA